MNSHLSESSIVSALAKQLCERIAKSAIQWLQELDVRLSGDGSELQNTWEEICVQVQYTESVYWDSYLETIHAFVQCEVDDLQKFEREAIWLQTPDGDDWIDDDDSREPYPVVPDAIIEYIVSDHILAEAGRWSNENVRAYIDRSSFND